MLVGKIQEMRKDKDNDTYIKLDVFNFNFGEQNIKFVNKLANRVDEYYLSINNLKVMI